MAAPAGTLSSCLLTPPAQALPASGWEADERPQCIHWTVVAPARMGDATAAYLSCLGQAHPMRKPVVQTYISIHGAGRSLPAYLGTCIYLMYVGTTNPYIVSLTASPPRPLSIVSSPSREWARTHPSRRLRAGGVWPVAGRSPGYTSCNRPRQGPPSLIGAAGKLHAKRRQFMRMDRQPTSTSFWYVRRLFPPFRSGSFYSCRRTAVVARRRSTCPPARPGSPRHPRHSRSLPGCHGTSATWRLGGESGKRRTARTDLPKTIPAVAAAEQVTDSSQGRSWLIILGAPLPTPNGHPGRHFGHGWMDGWVVARIRIRTHSASWALERGVWSSGLVSLGYPPTFGRPLSGLAGVRVRWDWMYLPRSTVPSRGRVPPTSPTLSPLQLRGATHGTKS